jgi:hypothetical protein
MLVTCSSHFTIVRRSMVQILLFKVKAQLVKKTQSHIKQGLKRILSNLVKKTIVRLDTCIIDRKIGNEPQSRIKRGLRYLKR